MEWFFQSEDMDGFLIGLDHRRNGYWWWLGNNKVQGFKIGNVGISIEAMQHPLPKILFTSAFI